MEKKQIILCVVLSIVGVLVFILASFLDYSRSWLVFIFSIVLINSHNIIGAINRKKRIKRIDAMREKLNLSIEDVRGLAEIGRFDLPNWDFKNAMISPKQMLKLEEELDKKYQTVFGERLTFEKTHEK